MKKISCKSLITQDAGHRGQSMLEVAVALPFLLLMVIALIEMGIVFASYIALVNGAREGVVFATMCPAVLDSSQDTDSSCMPGKLNVLEYRDRIANEIVPNIGGPLVAGELQYEDASCNDPGSTVVNVYLRCLRVDRPVTGPAPGPNCSGTNPKAAGCPITITVHYRIKTFSSGISLPVPRFRSTVLPTTSWTQWFFNILGNVDWSTGWRMGLPDYYQLDYSIGMPMKTTVP